MADGSTTNFDMTLPDVGGSDGSWGGKLNDNFTLLDTLLAKTLRAPTSIGVIPSVTTRAGKALGFDASGNPIALSVSGVSDPSLRADLALLTGTSLIATSVDGAGVGRPLNEKLADSVNAKDFGVVGDGVANDTVAMKAFFDYCIANATPGHIPAGTYRIQRGQLAFDNGFTDKIFPTITTDGYEAVTFVGIDATNLPMITISNGDAPLSGAGKYWRGGGIGGISFEDSVSETPGDTNRHALSLRGIYGMRFGWMKLDSAAGSTVYLPNKTRSGDPDPYAVSFCTFEGIEANFCNGRAVSNFNGVGMNFCSVDAVRAVQTQQGGIYGLGAGNHFRYVSMGSCKSWAVYDGIEGTVDRCYITDLELDDVQYGIRINQATRVVIDRCRFIARYQYSALNTSEGYWPRLALELGAGSSPNIRGLKADLVFRIDAGGVLADYGEFINAAASTASIQDSQIDVNIFDNAALGITDTKLTGTIPAGNQMIVRRAGKIVFDGRLKHIAAASYTTNLTVPNGTIATTSANILNFANERFDVAGDYNPVTYGFTVPFTGYARVTISVPLTVASGTRVDIGILLLRSGSYTIGPVVRQYAASAAAQTYSISRIIAVNKDDVIFAAGGQNTGAGVTTTAIYNTEDVIFQVEML